MREAQQRRWAKVRGEAAAAKPKPAKRKRRLSAAGRRAIAEATKKRWAAVRASKAKQAATKAGGKKSVAKTGAEKIPGQEDASLGHARAGLGVLGVTAGPR